MPSRDIYPSIVMLAKLKHFIPRPRGTVCAEMSGTQIRLLYTHSFSMAASTRRPYPSQ